MANGADKMAQMPELRKKLAWTILILCMYRVGVHVPVPGIDAGALSHFFASMQGSVFALLDMFSGGGLSNVSVFALGIMPYISASIILQLLQVVDRMLLVPCPELLSASRLMLVTLLPQARP